MRSLLRPSTLPGTDLTAWLLPQMSLFCLEMFLTHVHCPVLLSLAPWQVAPATQTSSSRQKSSCAISVQRNERCLSIKNMLKIGSYRTLQPPTNYRPFAGGHTVHIISTKTRRFQLKGQKSDIHSNLYNNKKIKKSAIMRRLTLITVIVFQSLNVKSHKHSNLIDHHINTSFVPPFDSNSFRV